MSRSRLRTLAPSTRPARRAVRAILVVLVSLGLSAGAYAAVAASKPALAVPTITTKPTSPTSAISASFAFTGPSGATFECRLDAAAFATCTTPKVYRGPLAQGSHTFQVRSVSGSAQSDTASYAWTVDTTAPPVPTLTSKPESLSNSTSATIAFSDAEADVAFRCGIDGSASTACASPRKYINLAQGPHTFAVQAVDVAGNASALVTWSWSVDTVAPPAPALTQKPTDPTPNATNIFAWTDAEVGVRFECSTENGEWKPCSLPFSYVIATGNLSQHQFAVRALDPSNNVSSTTTYQYKYGKSQPATGVPFTITGTVGGLSIGVWKPIVVTLANPNAATIFVTALAVTVAPDSTPGGCASTSNLELQPSNISSTQVVAVPAGGSVVLPTQGATAPQIRLKNLPTVNQDVCKNKTFTLTYSGTANN